MGTSVLLYEPYFSCVEHAAPRYRTEGFTAAARGRQDASLPEPDHATLFDHLVGAGEQLRRHGEAEHPGGLVVDHQLELG